MTTPDELVRLEKEKLKVVEALYSSWKKYVSIFGENVHGTKMQISAMMELGFHRFLSDRETLLNNKIERLEAELKQQKEFFDLAYKDSEYFQKHYRLTEQILTECHAGINKAIMSEDGLDGSDGLELLKKIEKEFPHLKQAFSGDGEKED